MPAINEELKKAENRLAYTKYILLLALIIWPLGLFISPMASLLIFAILAVLWAVTTYIAFMHTISIKNKKLRR